MNEAAYRAILKRLGVQPTLSRSSEVSRLIAMPFDVFALQGQPLEVRVTWWPATLWFVPDVRHAEALREEGVTRERVWTASELLSLLGGAPWTAETLRLVMITRREFDGEVVAAHPRANPSRR
jgi:hypothetical protein